MGWGAVGKCIWDTCYAKPLRMRKPQPPAMPPRGKRKSSGQESKKYEEEYEKCSCDELRQKLVELGENPGPIDASNK